MNSINFFNDKKKFPLSTQVLDFFQDIIKKAYNLASLAGNDKHILSGCENINGNTWNSGYVVLNGELLPFLGGTGTVDSTVRIKEVKVDIVAEYDTYSEVLTNRYVEFGSNVGGADTYTWGTFKRLKSLTQIVNEFATKAELDAVRLLVMPRGAIIEYDLKNNPLPLPVGWVSCVGGSLDGYGNIPDKRERVTIGYNPDSNNTPTNVIDERETNGSLKRNYGAVGNTGGKYEVQLTKQESGLPDFTIDLGYNSKVDGTGDNNEGWVPNDTANVHVIENVVGKSAEKSHENRMPYVVGYFIVKVV